MTKDKELLLKDLCARLPYHVKCKIWLKDGTTEEGLLDLEHNYGNVLQDAFYYNKIKDIKPYLRPISSMTYEEKVKYLNICGIEMNNPLSSPSYNGVDYLNSIHVDYRGLIFNGLAIEVTKDNNPYKD